MAPSFLITNTGSFILFCVGVLAIIAIITTILKHSHSFAFLLIGLAILFPLIIKRRKDKKLYEKMKDLQT